MANQGMGSASNRFEGSKLEEKAGSMLHDATEMAKNAASSVQDKARDVAGSVQDKARDFANRGSEFMSDAQRKAADAASAVKDYVSEHDYKDMASDVTGVIRRYPIASVAVGFCLGVFLARMTTRD